MGFGVAIFAVGSRWVIYGFKMLSGYRDMWPILCVAIVLAWLLHGTGLEDYLANTPVGPFFSALTVYATVLLLHVSNIPVSVTGETLSFGPPSLIGGVQVTPLCAGFLSLLMFIAAFSFVILDVGRELGVARLTFLLLTGAIVTFAASILRVFIVIIVGIYYGLDALSEVHTFLGYVVFLTVICLFWYASLSWSNSIKTSTTCPTKTQNI